jgi:pyruvate kinase
MDETRAKIVVTIGPASRAPGVLRDLLAAGADAFRVNGAHAPPESLAGLVRDLRRAARGLRREVAVLLDLPGVKVRIGRLPGGSLEVTRGEELRLVPGARPHGASLPLALPVPRAVLAGLSVGAEILLADGNVVLEALAVGKEGATCRVSAGGVLRDRTGIHVRGARHQGAVLLAADYRLAEAGVAAGVDAIAISFVRGPEDVRRLRRHLEARRLRMPVLVAKIERREAVDGLDAVLDAVDGIMVARGDLGLEYGPELVPGLQKRILEGAARRGRFAITATQMLETMTTATRPTRAEASDVANAVFDGSDAVMLSGETAVGTHPALVVATMSRILAAAEADPHCPYAGDPRHVFPVASPSRPDRLVVRSAVRLAQDAEAAAVVVFTRGGQSARRLAKERPRAPIYAFAYDPDVLRGLLLSWGVRPRRLTEGAARGRVVAAVRGSLRRDGVLRPGDRAVLVMGAKDDPTDMTTLIRLMTL